jgi:hypothetical protein
MNRYCKVNSAPLNISCRVNLELLKDNLKTYYLDASLDTLGAITIPNSKFIVHPKYNGSDEATGNIIKLVN